MNAPEMLCCPVSGCNSSNCSSRKGSRGEAGDMEIAERSLWPQRRQERMKV